MSKSFQKKQRLVRGSEFTRTLRKGVCAADGTLVLYALPSTTSTSPRLGVTIPKKTGNAVVRNRWKRLIRESFRTQQQQLPTGYDFVIRPKKGASPNWISIKKSVPALAKKAIRRDGQRSKSNQKK